MKKICVTSVVSLLIAFVLVFAGCEQPEPATAGLNNGGGDDGDNVSAVVDVGDDGDNVSAVVDVGDDGDNVSAVVDVKPDDPPVVVVIIHHELSIVDSNGNEGPFWMDYYNPITLKAVDKNSGIVSTDVIWKAEKKTIGSSDIPFSLQDNGDGTCTLIGFREFGSVGGCENFIITVSDDKTNTSCEIGYQWHRNDEFIDS